MSADADFVDEECDSVVCVDSLRHVEVIRIATAVSFVDDLRNKAVGITLDLDVDQLYSVISPC